LGIAHFHQNQTDKAIKDYQKAMDLDKRDADAPGNLAIALVSQGKFPEAEAAYRQSIALNGNLPLTHLGLGQVLLELREHTAALASLKRAKELAARQPGSPGPTLELLRQAELLATLEEKLPAVLAGQEKLVEGAEALVLAELCWRRKDAML